MICNFFENDLRISGLKERLMVCCLSEGTALGVVRKLFEMNRLEHIYCTETRPYNQGARLTAFELVHDKLPATLIIDSMVAALLRSKVRIHYLLN